MKKKRDKGPNIFSIPKKNEFTKNANFSIKQKKTKVIYESIWRNFKEKKLKNFLHDNFFTLSLSQCVSRTPKNKHLYAYIWMDK